VQKQHAFRWQQRWLVNKRRVNNSQLYLFSCIYSLPERAKAAAMKRVEKARILVIVIKKIVDDKKLELWFPIFVFILFFTTQKLAG
jgi:hypothetical protein